MSRGRVITLKFAGHCRECGAKLPAGSRARWYGKGRVYGLDCHKRDNSGQIPYTPGEPEGLTRSRFDRYGVYSPDGRKLGSTCGCIDYPCCGH